MNRQRKQITVIIIVSIIILGIIGTLITLLAPKESNPYGKNIPISNYKDEVKNLPYEREQAISAALYNTVKLNGVDDEKLINHAIIRAGSTIQEYKEKGETYKGGFIVDMETIRQSYQVTYSYSKRETNNSGYSVVITCLPKDKLIYGDFSCTDLLRKESGTTDPIIQFLPYSALTYSITPDSTSGSLVLRVTLKIPDIDLSGDKASKKQTITLYKDEVKSWIRSHGLSPDSYTIIYNYTDDGEKVQ